MLIERIKVSNRNKLTEKVREFSTKPCLLTSQNRNRENFTNEVSRVNSSNFFIICQKESSSDECRSLKNVMKVRKMKS